MVWFLITRGTPRFLFLELRNATTPPTANLAVISGGKIYRHHFKQIHFSNQTPLTEHLFFGNTINIVITALL